MERSMDGARRFLSSAKQANKMFRRLLCDAEIGDRAIGYHAQQVVKKSLKAVLVLNGVEIPKIHDLCGLLDLLANHRLPEPPHVEEIKRLNVFGALLREDLLASVKLDRDGTRQMVDHVSQWAREQVR